MAHRVSTSVVGLMVFACAMAAPAMAEDAEAQPVEAGSSDAGRYEVSDEDVSLALEPKTQKVQAALAPYIWLTSLSGSTTEGGIKLDVDESFFDLADAADSLFGLMGSFDMKIDRFVFQLNGAWSTVDFSGEQRPGPNAKISSNLNFQTLWMESFIGYRFLEKPVGEDPASRRKLSLDAFVGVRYTAVKQSGSVKVKGGITLPEGGEVAISEKVDFDGTRDWFEPFIGLRLGYDLTEHWEVMVRGDIGGFGAGSDFAWQAFGGVGYRWYLKGWSIAAFGGFRALGQDYSDGDYAWDMITYGPVLGAQFSFAF